MGKDAAGGSPGHYDSSPIVNNRVYSTEKNNKKLIKIHHHTHGLLASPAQILIYPGIYVLNVSCFCLYFNVFLKCFSLPSFRM